MRRTIRMALIGVTMVAVASTTAGQQTGHEGHDMPAPGSDTAIAACLEHQEMALAALAAAGRVAEAARQQNSPARMRADADELQNLIADAGAHLGECQAALQRAGAAPMERMDHHLPGGHDEHEGAQPPDAGTDEAPPHEHGGAH